MNLQRIAVLILMALIVILCITLMCLIEELDDDSSVMLNYVIMSCSGIFILLTLLEAYFYFARPKCQQIQYPRIILLILAPIVILYAAITQISRALLDDNGNGKVPIIDPHDADWYRLKKITRIIEYTVCFLVIIIQILIAHRKQQMTSTIIEESVLSNQEPLITSLEPQSIKQNNSQIDSTPHVVNTLESKNTNQVIAIKKLNEQQNT